jgi:YidC/Oxa1 family membrane protein insertase
MDSGRFLLAIVLMIALVIVTQVIFPPVPPPAPGTAADSVAEAPSGTRPPIDTAGRPEPRPAAELPVAPPVEAGDRADTVSVESDLYRFGFSTHGGAIVSAQLKRHRSATRDGPVELTPDDAAALVRFRLRVGDAVIDLDRLPFESEVVRAENGAGDVVRFVHRPDSARPAIELEYRLDPDQYVFDVRARVPGTGGETPQLLIDFAPTLRSNEANPRDDEAAIAYTVNNARTGIESVFLRDVEAERIENGPLHWTALKNKYFLLAAIESDSARTPFGGLIARPTTVPNTAETTTTLLASPEGDFAFRLYIGPQETDRLIAIGYDLRDVNAFGWKPLQPILRPIGHAITWALVGMHRVLGLGYGWVLVLFGILVRVVLWPLNAKAMRAQLKNMEIQPRLKEIQTKYKSDPERLQKEMLRLYKEEGFNPMGGCLPILIPFPILIALFFVFQSTIEFRGVSFLWLPDLSLHDPLYILPILLGASMFVLQWLSMRSTKDANPQMKFMMYFMPIFMTVLFLKFASGLNLYYASMNVASLPQQLQIMRERKRWQAGRPAAGR